MRGTPLVAVLVLFAGCSTAPATPTADLAPLPDDFRETVAAESLEPLAWSHSFVVERNATIVANVSWPLPAGNFAVGFEFKGQVEGPWGAHSCRSGARWLAGPASLKCSVHGVAGAELAVKVTGWSSVGQAITVDITFRPQPAT